MRAQWMVIVAAAALLPAFSAEKAKTRSAGDHNPADWPMYTGDLAGTRFSRLTQINTGNVSQLKEAWSVRMRAGGEERRAAGPRGGPGGPASAPAPAGGSPEVTPIVIGVVMYLPAGSRVLALDAATGKEIWSYTLDGERTNSRGVAYWPGDKDNPPRILFTAGHKLFGLNATTGKLDPGFGNEGQVDIVVGWSGVPAIYKNVVLLGASVGEMPTGPAGDSRAYDARTGKKLWEFHTVPRPGELGHDTWLDDGWKGRSGTNVWAWYLTVDEQRGLVYMPIGSPSANYWGGDRPGNNLFGNSIVAVDAETGKLKWFFQTVHHDLWDSDLPPAPSLIDINVNGKKVPALAAIGKTAWMFILDRVTGKPVFGVEERPVAKGNVPGEWYSPTQPFPLKPPALARTSFKPDDIVTAEDTTPEHAKACRDLVERSGGFYNAGPFTPFLLHDEGAPPRSTIIFPGNGGANWGGTAADPTSGYVYVQTHDTALVGWMEKKRKGGNYGSGNGSPQPYDRGSVDGPGPYHGFSAPVKDANGKVIGNWPCQKPPWGRLSAVNANTGEIAWQVPLGITEGLPEARQHTGGTGSAGPIVTAGGLVLIGATNDKRFRAFDSKTGKELWAVKLDAAVNANPLTYEGKDGKQYIAVMDGPSLVAFALP